MATATPIARPSQQTRTYYPLAGALSYLVPGLGQIVQGRVAKGVLFLVCIYALFFYGIYLGTGTVTIGPRTYHASTAVYLPDLTDPSVPHSSLRRLGSNLYNRPQFVAQFWVGVAAWPAIVQYLTYDREAHLDIENQYDAAARKWEQGQNLLLEAEEKEQAAKKLRGKEREEMLATAKERRDDAELALSQARADQEKAAEREKQLGHKLLGGFEREPSTASYNAVHNAGDKRQELAWVFTVIAGVLNILVIYDAVAGPAHGAASGKEKKG